MNNKSLVLSFLVAFVPVCHIAAQNPIISSQFTADPTARVFNGKMYLYPSHDIPSPIEKLKTWFCMPDYHVFSSSNLTDWQDHGVIVSQDKVPWVQDGSYTMWAPDCVEKDGKYYFYFPAAPKGEEKGFGVGVAIADDPAGPFMPMWKPIEGIHGIDPCVLIDKKDGQAYIYWAGNGLRMAKLKPNMMELASEPQLVEGLPEGFKEGPFAFERNGKYYITFPWVREKNGTETLAYAMADHPMGPFTFKGVIMDESPTKCWTNHHSIVEYQGQWYLFYHHNDYSPKFDKNRSVRIDSLSFNADGTIQKVIPTLRGVGITSARSRMQIDRYSSIQGARIEYLDTTNYFAGWKTIFDQPKSSLIYNNVDFGKEKVEQITVRAKSSKGGVLVVRADGKNGNVIAKVRIPKSAVWQDIHAKILNAPLGRHALQVSLQSGADVEVDWLGFDALPWEKGAFETHQYRNLLAEMGYKQSDIDKKVNEVFHDVFYGKNKVYFEVGDSLGYISDIKNHDVRTEGMSYGMMIAVQFDKKDIFDRLWRWSKKYMQHQDGPYKGYFAWSCTTDGKRNAQGPASDGELYYITSLIFASNRWGNDTGINYLKEAQNILDCSMQKVGMDRTAPLINLEHQLITFTPDHWGGKFTDPSYHLPAFYEVWAKWANDGRSQFWKECAEKSRQFLHQCINEKTGLNPDYCNFDGSLMKTGQVLGDAFRYDSWRVPMNVALDYSWSCQDKKWQQQYANTIQDFLYSKGIDDFVDQYNVDGTMVTDTLRAGDAPKALRHSIGLVATSAAASLVCTHVKGKEFVDKLWKAKHEIDKDGYFDGYYDGLLRLFAFMHLSGRYQVIEPNKNL